MSKSRFEFNAHERKFHVLTAFRLYQVEMYIAQKAMNSHKFKVDGKDVELKLEDAFKDYETQTSLSVLFETIAVFEPKLYDRIKKSEIHEAIAETVTYLTGNKVNPENVGEKPVQPSAKSNAEGALQVKDLTDKNKIIVTRTMPKNPKRAMRNIGKN